jgi:UDP-glucose 4-epimerase
VIDSFIPNQGGTLENLKGYEDKIVVHDRDIRDLTSLEPVLAQADVLFNLAGQSSHRDSMTDPHLDLAINCGGQLALLESCRFFQLKMRIVFASTRQV